ncbi:hypothetical protein [Hyphococcus luteus]|uniref:YCII-related domain-containing protein n=1 Tax=Hyphococcus luteus TaxID=2058213 RepID=A0A2S7K5A5_9PROT|nr:hypothetical protein [Marinicaulis flavus]PQA87656.1 hypothetical protein CW354_11315 [Marinicaulis flavus]
MTNHFAVIVQRGASWDQAAPSSEQPDYEEHSAIWRKLESDGFVAMAGLMKDSMEVLFIIRADSIEEVKKRIGEDPWQKDGLAKIVRVEPIDIRFGAPSAPR